jgi:hypothetical protein
MIFNVVIAHTRLRRLYLALPEILVVRHEIGVCARAEFVQIQTLPLTFRRHTQSVYAIK